MWSLSEILALQLSFAVLLFRAMRHSRALETRNLSNVDSVKNDYRQTGKQVSGCCSHNLYIICKWFQACNLPFDLPLSLIKDKLNTRLLSITKNVFCLATSWSAVKTAQRSCAVMCITVRDSWRVVEDSASVLDTETQSSSFALSFLQHRA